MISTKLKSNIYFNVDKKSGRWIFSNKPQKINKQKTLSELNEWDDVIKTIIINVTNKCNLNCVYCSRQCARQTPGNMNLDLIKKILKDASNYAIKNKINLTVQFHGGGTTYRI